MNKSDLIAAVAEHATLSKADAGKAVEICKQRLGNTEKKPVWA